jgi:hypothetical protein
MLVGLGACAEASSGNPGTVDAFAVPDAPSTLADAPPPTVDARPGAPDAMMSTIDAAPGTPDAAPIPDAMSIPDAAPPPPDAGFTGGTCTSNSQCPSGTCDTLFGLCECDLILNDCPGTEVCTLFIVPPGTYCDAP